MHPWLRKLIPFTEENSGEQIVQKTALRIDSTDRIRQLIRHEIFRSNTNPKAETWEEANDFDFDDPDEKWDSPYEEHFDPDEPFPESGGGQSPPNTAPPDPPPANPPPVNNEPPPPQSQVP